MTVAEKTKPFVSPPEMLSWQYREMIFELGEVSRHAADPHCPCLLADKGEYCIPKHLLSIHGLARETSAMEENQANIEMLEQLVEEAFQKHTALKDRIVCKNPHEDEGDIVEWARQWRKKFENIYYHSSCSLKKGAAAMKQDIINYSPGAPVADLGCPICLLGDKSSGYGEISNYVNRPQAQKFKFYIGEFPSGKWGYMGYIPVALTKPGTSNSLLFATREEAVAAAKKEGFEHGKTYSVETGACMEKAKSCIHYRELADIAKQEKMPDVSRTLNKIAKQEDSHNQKIEGLIGKHCGGAEMEQKGKAALKGTFFVKVTIAGKEFEALVDTGADAMGIPASAIKELKKKLFKVGSFEISTADGTSFKDMYATEGVYQGKPFPALVIETPTPLFGAVALEFLHLKVNPVEKKLEPIPGFAQVTGLLQMNGTLPASEMVITGKGERVLVIGAGPDAGAVRDLANSIAPTIKYDDPVLKKIHMELCPGVIPCLLEPDKSKKPVCSASQKQKREDLIQDLKARNREAGCSKEEGTGSKKCPNVFAIANARIGCRTGRKS